MGSIIMPALSVGVAGGILGLIIGIVAKAFEVKGEQLTMDIREALPGLNCGVCGFAGCENYAQALATGEESEYNLCVPGKEKAANAIKKLLEQEGML